MSRVSQDDGNLPLKFSSILSASLHINAANSATAAMAQGFVLLRLFEFCFLSFAVLLFEVFQSSEFLVFI